MEDDYGSWELQARRGTGSRRPRRHRTLDRDVSPQTWQSSVQQKLHSASVQALKRVPSVRDLKAPIEKATEASKRQIKRSSDLARLRLFAYLSYLQALQQQRHHRPRQQPKAASDSEPAAQLVLGLGSKQDSRQFTAGVLLFGSLLYLAGAAPWLLPMYFLVFAAVALPWRAADFHSKKWTFFMCDLCYTVNLAVVGLLLFAPDNVRLEAVVQALANGPLSAALIVWQSAWVFGSAAHSVSVLIHLLPGLAVFARKYASIPPGVAAVLPGWLPLGLRSSVLQQQPAWQPSGLAGNLWWLFALPLGFYLAWQLLYFLTVQVVFRGFILRNGYDTSYMCLARRAAKSNNIWNRLVRRGSTLRRISMYGLLQLVFTVVVLVLFVPVFHSFWLGLLWQVIKAVAPVWYGARWQCEKVPKHAVLKVLKQQAAVAHCQEPTVQSKALDLKQQPKQLPAERALA